MAKGQTNLSGALLALVLVIAILLSAAYYQTILDQFKLFGYVPTETISKLAGETTMTSTAKNLFYVNHPKLQDKSQFKLSCPNNNEKTTVLGCYKSYDNGIFILRVNDDRLYGVEQVTAAHEMLHAGYARLNDAERENIDGQLMAYFESSSDKHLIETINEYKKSDPSELANEMYAVFGSEVGNLPRELESHYERYFTNRKAVVDLARSYRKTFTDLEDRIAKIDSGLEDLKQAIESGNQELHQLNSDLQSRRSRLNALAAQGDGSAYNSEADQFNQAVNRYNTLLETVKTDTARYNQLVGQRNEIAITINDLGHELDANSEPLKTHSTPSTKA